MGAGPALPAEVAPRARVRMRMPRAAGAAAFPGLVRGGRWPRALAGAVRRSRGGVAGGRPGLDAPAARAAVSRRFELALK